MLVLSAICGVHGELVQVNWTPSGVADYRDPRYTAGCGMVMFWRAMVAI